MSAEVVRVLKDARSIIEDEGRWCQGAMARTTKYATSPFDPQAIKWCAFGAIAKQTANNDDLWLASIDVLDEAAVLVYGIRQTDLFRSPAVLLNDKLDHASVLATFDRAIELAESAP